MRTERLRTRSLGLRFLVIATALALVAAACAEAEPEPPVETDPVDAEDGPLAHLFPDGVVRIGLADEFPYAFIGEDGQPTGEAPTVAIAILNELGITEVEASVVEFGALIGGIQADQYDMIAAGMFITPDRAQEIIFSDPDYCGTTAFAVPDGNPMGLNNYQDIIDTGAELGLLAGAIEVDDALDSGVPAGQISEFGDVPSLFDALQAGRVDTVALTDFTVTEQTAAIDGFESSGGFVPVVDGEERLGCGAYGFLDQEFRDIFNEKLNEFQAEDRIFPLVEPFGFSREAVDLAAGLTVDDLLDD